MCSGSGTGSTQSDKDILAGNTRVGKALHSLLAEGYKEELALMGWCGGNPWSEGDAEVERRKVLAKGRNASAI